MTTMNVFLHHFPISLLNFYSVRCCHRLNWYNIGLRPCNAAALDLESLTNMYAGMYLRCTTGAFPIGGSSGWRIISTISPHAPFVRSRSISIFFVTITFMPMANSTVHGRSLNHVDLFPFQLTCWDSRQYFS